MIRTENDNTRIIVTERFNSQWQACNILCCCCCCLANGDRTKGRSANCKWKKNVVECHDIIIIVIVIISFYCMTEAPVNLKVHTAHCNYDWLHYLLLDRNFKCSTITWSWASGRCFWSDYYGNNTVNSICVISWEKNDESGLRFFRWKLRHVFFLNNRGWRRFHSKSFNFYHSGNKDVLREIPLQKSWERKKRYFSTLLRTLNMNTSVFINCSSINISAW